MSQGPRMTLGKMRTAAKQAAKTQGVSQYRIQKETGLAPATVDRFFSSAVGGVRVDTALRILQFLGLDLSIRTPKTA